MKNKNMSKKLKIFSSVTIILLLGVLVFTLVVNSGIRSKASERDTRLDKYEATKLWVLEDVRSYLTVKDKESYKDAKDNSHMTSELLSELYGGSFSSRVFPSYSNVSFIDAQYSIEETDSFMVYILANVSKGGKTESVNFLVSLDNNKIFSIIPF